MADIGITKFRVQIPRDGATPSTPGFAQSEGQDPVNPPGSPTGIYVPYLGATGAVNLGEFGLLAGNLVFDTTPTNIPTDQGTMYWDDARQTVALIMNGTTQHVGQFLSTYVKNSSGASIPKGVNVRNSGTDGGSGHVLIELFLADGTHPSETYLGVTAEEIPNGGFGQVIDYGKLPGINTSTYTAGAFLYVSTTVAGQFQTTAPVAPNNIILVGRAINSKNNGDIFIRPHIGSNINNDEGVKITSPATGDLLQLQSGGLWENKSLATIGIPTGSGANGRVTFWTGANTQGSDGGFLWNNSSKSLGIGGLLTGCTFNVIFPNSSTGTDGFKVRNSDGLDIFSIRNSGGFTLLGSSTGIPTLIRNQSIGGIIRFRGLEDVDVVTIGRTGRVFANVRSGSSNELSRRDELYLNYSQTVATAGTINDLAINSDCKLLILTACDDLTGVVFVDSTRLLRIEARGGNRIIRDQNAASIAANRFALGADLTINDGEVYQFIYTNARWRRVL